MHPPSLRQIPPRRERGYLLIVIAVLLTTLMVVTTQFMARSAQNTRMAEITRDNAQSLQLAESVSNLLHGYLSYNGDLNKDGIPDKDQIVVDLVKPPAKLPLPYVFFVTSGKEIDQAKPSILQRVADGEARSVKTGASSQAIKQDKRHLSVQGLFGKDFAPLVYVIDDKGDLVPSTKNWKDEKSYQRATAWIELVRSPGGSLLFYVAAVGAVGDSQSYVQRFIGEASETLGGGIGPLNQSS